MKRTATDAFTDHEGTAPADRPRQPLLRLQAAALLGGLITPLITLAIGQTPIPDGDLPTPELTAWPAALAGALSAWLYVQRRWHETGRSGAPTRRALPRWLTRHLQPDARPGRQHRWTQTLPVPLLWALATAAFGGLIASAFTLFFATPIIVPMAVLGSMMPVNGGFLPHLTHDPRLLALLCVPPVAFAPLIAAALRGLSGTTFGLHTRADVIRRAVPPLLPLAAFLTAFLLRT